MAELLLKVDDAGLWKDGDIIHAMNDRRIKCVHAEHLCHPKTQPRIKGRMEANCLADDFQRETMEYKFQRISEYEVVRTTLATGEEVTISKTPQLIDGRMQYIDVTEFLARRLKNPHNLIYGSEGSEYWYGGKKDYSATKVGNIWTHIESKTDNVRDNFTSFPWGRLDKSVHLVVPVEEVTDEEAVDLETPLFDAQGEITSKRKKHVLITEVSEKSQVSINDIQDKTKQVNIPDKVPVTVNNK